MTIQVRDNKTNTIIKQNKTNDWSHMYVKYINGYRREYTNATIEVFYGEPKGNPTTTYKTFH